MRHLTLATALVLALTTAVPAGRQAPPAQPEPSGSQPPVTFKVEVNYVEVDAIVVDAQGRFVRDLKRDDFRILEDGKPQSVTTFALVDIPIERADRPLFAAEPIEPDVLSNARAFDGRVYMIVLDDLHTNVMRSPRVKLGAKQFIERHLGANDLAAIVYTSGRTDASQEFTSSRRLLLAAVDKFMGRKLRSSTQERIDQYYNQRGIRAPGERIDDPRDPERGYNARVALNTIRHVADWMSGIRGRRKALVYLSEGIDYDINDVINNRYASSILDEARETIATATRANVSIYAVDPRGLTQLGDEGIEIAGLPDDPTLGLGPASLQNELRLSQDSLRILADETGGFAAVNANDFRGAFERIVSDNSSYYVLGYYPTNEKRDGRFRKIEVRVDRPGLTVRARKGYAAPRGKANAKQTEKGPAAELADAINRPLQTPGLKLAATAAPFKGAAPNASVVLTIEADVRNFKFAEQQGKFVDTMEMSIVALDSEGKIRATDRSTLNMGLKPETYERVGELGFRVLSRLDVPPGRYQVRAGARESGTGLLGSVFYDLVVPDFSKESFSMSGLVIGSASGARVPTARGEVLKDLIPTVPTTAREFLGTDELAAFVEVYDNEADKPHKVDITASVLTDDGRVVFKNQEERSSGELGGSRGGFGYAARIPLKDMTPGLYVLRVEATSRLGDRKTASRQVQFRIR